MLAASGSVSRAKGAGSGPGPSPWADPQGGGWPQVGGKKTPAVVARIEELMNHETAGDPMSDLKWTRRTTVKIATELQSIGIQVSARTVAKLLKKMGFSLRVNHKKLAGNSHPNRDAQFARIAELREQHAAQQLPIISVDTKKKELVGVFKNPGAKWDRNP